MASPQKSCSVPKRMGERLEKAAEENDMLESEVIRRALRFYEDANPDGFEAFKNTSHGPSVAEIDSSEIPTKTNESGGMTAGGVGGVGRGRTGSDRDESDSESGIYDPTEDMREDREEEEKEEGW